MAGLLALLEPVAGVLVAGLLALLGDDVLVAGLLALLDDDESVAGVLALLVGVALAVLALLDGVVPVDAVVFDDLAGAAAALQPTRVVPRMPRPAMVMTAVLARSGLRRRLLPEIRLGASDLVRGALVMDVLVDMERIGRSPGWVGPARYRLRRSMEIAVFPID
ncbi:MAG: hypothetical protein JWQ47_1480 [Glaciihabitans sp.]|nr:hypothetical protein [Glaciihabitans sp.]